MKVPLLKTTPIQLTEHGDVELVSTQNLPHCVPESLVQEDTLHALKRNVDTEPATGPLSTTMFYLQDMLRQRWHEAVGITNQ